MRRGDVYLVDLEPTVGSEASNTRPAVIVSNNGANTSAENRGAGIITVVPVTSNTSRVYPFQTLLTAGEGGLTLPSKTQAEQVRAVSTLRLGRRLGAIRPQSLRALDDALRLHLSL